MNKSKLRLIDIMFMLAILFLYVSNYMNNRIISSMLNVTGRMLNMIMQNRQLIEHIVAVLQDRQ